MSGWGYAGLAVAMVVLLVLLAAVIVALVRFAGGDQPSRYVPPAQHLGAQELLGVRFARGEIDEKEYRDKLAVLRDHSSV